MRPVAAGGSAGGGGGAAGGGGGGCVGVGEVAASQTDCCLLPLLSGCLNSVSEVLGSQTLDSGAVLVHTPGGPCPVT